jgi:hypothetical protein
MDDDLGGGVGILGGTSFMVEGEGEVNLVCVESLEMTRYSLLIQCNLVVSE